MQILSAADCERLILALHNGQPLSEEDRRALILELIAARRRALDHAAPRRALEVSREEPTGHTPAP